MLMSFLRPACLLLCTAATACPSPGTVARLNVTWLDQAQLDHMHDTEAVGIAYDYVQIDAGVVDHGQRPADKVFDQPVFGYQARAGVLARDGSPVAQRALRQRGGDLLRRIRPKCSPGRGR